MKDFLIFIRAGMLPLTMFVPVLGYWCGVEGLGDGKTIALLLCIGAAAHIFGFGLNDIVDKDIDKHASYRSDSPLVSGKYKIQGAWVVVLLQLPIMFICYHVGGDHARKFYGDVFLLLSILLSVVYNSFSKKGFVKKWIAEISLALSITFLCLAGSYMYKYEVSVPTVLFAGSFGLVLLSVNSLGSGLKDLKTDLEAGGKSFVIENGARMIGEDQIFIPRRLKIFGFALQCLLVVNFAAYHQSLQLVGLISLVPLLFLVFGFFHLNLLLSQKTLSMLHKKGPLLYGYFNLIALILLELPVLPIASIIFLLIGLQLIFLYFRYKYFT